MKNKLVVAASLGNCVHVAGAVHFLSLAEDEGFDTMFLGPAVPASVISECVKREKPDIVSLGYRLTPANVVPLVEELRERVSGVEHRPVWVFAGTKPVAREVEKLGFFDVIFDGTEDIDDCIAFLRTGKRLGQAGESDFAKTLEARVDEKTPYPILRHHFGLPSYDDTLKGVGEIARAGVLDVISLGIDQNTQEFFFKPEKRNPAMDGAGGVPVHSEEEFSRLKEASACGNYPLMRCYSGTDDVVKLAEVLRRTIDNAWCAVPLCWYNELDGRGTRPLLQSMREAHELIRLHAKMGVPVEINEPHHWGLRDAHDVISVAMAYISAYNAKRLGVKTYVSQYMFNIPNSMSFSMDLAKVMAQNELVERLASPDFRVLREVRTGLPFLSGDIEAAKGQLAASTMLQMSVKPHIIHVVGFSEAERAADPAVVIESCRIVRGVVRSVLHGSADMTADPAVRHRMSELISEADYLLRFITDRYAEVSKDPLCDPVVLTDCVKSGILDAPHIVKRGEYRGNLVTRMSGGSCLAYDPQNKKFMTEKERLERLFSGRDDTSAA